MASDDKKIKTNSAPAVGWSTQVAGRAANEPGWLDLTNFERHQARLLFGFTF